VCSVDSVALELRLFRGPEIRVFRAFRGPQLRVLRLFRGLRSVASVCSVA